MNYYLKPLLTKTLIFVFLIIAALVVISELNNKETIEVTATAYNSLPGQTHPAHPDIAAWGDKLEPGMKGIAVSRDLLQMGLTYNTEVKIEGLPGKYVVLDKMNKRWKKRIDIYMGKDRQLAREWGKQKVEITFKPNESVD